MQCFGNVLASILHTNALSGAMMSCSFLTVPVLLDTNSKGPNLVSQWARMYEYGQKIMPSLAIATLFCYIVACIGMYTADEPWTRGALAGAITISIVPFTFIVMLPTNTKLFQMQKLSRPSSPSALEARSLVTKWAFLHVARSLIPLAGAAIGVTSIFR